MFDHIKPNKEWQKLSEEMNGNFKKGIFFSSSRLSIPYKSAIYRFETEYSGDNFWRGQTVASLDFHYLRDFKLSIKNGCFGFYKHERPKIRIDRDFEHLKPVFQKLKSLNLLHQENNSYSIKFTTEGMVSKDYEVLPILKFKCGGYITEREQINLVLSTLHELADILQVEKIVRSW